MTHPGRTGEQQRLRGHLTACSPAKAGPRLRHDFVADHPVDRLVGAGFDASYDAQIGRSCRQLRGAGSGERCRCGLRLIAGGGGVPRRRRVCRRRPACGSTVTSARGAASAICRCTAAKRPRGGDRGPCGPLASTYQPARQRAGSTSCRPEAAARRRRPAVEDLFSGRRGAPASDLRGRPSPRVGKNRPHDASPAS